MDAEPICYNSRMLFRSLSRRALGAACAFVLAFATPAARADDSTTAQEGFDFKAATERAWHSAQDIAIYALGMIGVNYKFGGNTPDGGLDCSGLVRYVFQQVTGVTLPRTAREMGRMGEKVAMKDLLPGDLVFFNTRRFAYSHVGIYLGDNRFIHAPNRGSEVEIVQITDAYWRKHFNGARRLVGALPGLMIPSANAATIGAAEETPPDSAPADLPAKQ